MSDSPEASDSAPSPAPRRFSLISYLARRAKVLCWALLIPVVIPYLDGLWWGFDLLQHFNRHAIMVGLFLAVFALIFRWWREFAVALLSIACLAVPLIPYYRAAPPQVPLEQGKPVDEFTVLSANLHVGCSKPAAMLEGLTRASPDVLLLTECTPEWQKHLDPLLQTYPHHIGVALPHAFGIWLGSRHEFEMERMPTEEADDLPSVIARIRLPNAGRVGIVGAHPLPPMNRDNWEIQRTLMASYSDYLDEASGEARIIMGDFNAAPWSRIFQRLVQRSQLRDTALGTGTAPTWAPTTFPLQLGLPLDHILVTGRIELVSRSIGPDLGSDHRWVTATFRINGSGAPPPAPAPEPIITTPPPLPEGVTPDQVEPPQ